MTRGSCDGAPMDHADPDSDEDGAFRRVLCATGALLLIVTAIAWTIAPAQPPAPTNQGMARYFLVRQDLVAILIVEIAIVVALFVPAGGIARLLRPAPRVIAISLAIAMLVSCWAGAHLLLGGYALSRDEQMVGFDAAIFASGRLVATIPADLRDIAGALNQTFIQPIGDHAAWISAYLPMNAAIRAVFLWLGDATLAGPVLVAVGAIALWRIAARLWPTSPGSQIVALLLYAGSSQIWVTGMTAYAMSAHLALNLIWLGLFLKDRPWSHATAIVVGFVATGLHQVIFHPLFVLPFLDVLLRQKRWRLLGIYCAGYAAIGAFWLGWPVWIAAHGVAPAGDGIGFVDRYLQGLSGLRLPGLGLMAANLVRFAAWQHLLLLPLAGYGIYRFWNRDPVVRALATGLILPVVLTLIIIPYQGHGWGYRYLHGVIGNACLLGGFAWRDLAKRREAPATAMIIGTVASILVMLPVHAMMARHMTAPFAAVAGLRDATSAQTVVIDDDAAPFAFDLVLNAPDPAGSRLVVASRLLPPSRIAGLCRRGSIAFLGAAKLGDISKVLDGPPPVATANFVSLQEAARAAQCRIVEVGD